MCLAHRLIRLTDHHKFKLRRRLKPTVTRLCKAKVTVNLPDRGLSLIPRSLDRQDLTCCITYSHPSSIMKFMTRLNRTYRQRSRPGRWAPNVLHTFRCESNHPRRTCGWKTSVTVNSWYTETLVIVCHCTKEELSTTLPTSRMGFTYCG